MNIGLLDILVLISLSQGFIFALVLLISPIFRGSPNKFLAYTLIMIGIIGLNEWLSDWGFDDTYYFIDYFGDDIPWIFLVFVPMVYFFLRSLKHPDAHKPYLSLLATPFLIYTVLNLVVNFQFDFSFYQFDWMQDFQYAVYLSEDYLSPAYSLLLSFYSKTIIDKADAPEEQKLWMKRILVFFWVLILIWLVNNLLPYNLVNANHIFFYLLWCAISFFIYWLTYKGLYHLKLVQDREKLSLFFASKIDKPETGIGKTNKKPTPDFDKNNLYVQELDRLLQEEKLYQDPDLSRDQLAQRLGISSGYLSQILNSATGANFSDYIRNYRVEKVKELLLSPETAKYSLHAIGQEAGFKSKSAFYASFKKVVGMTPAEYKKNREVL
ncbi:MAG: helix-turn-helix domain-containing protein [Bacteroidota bacterium]